MKKLLCYYLFIFLLLGAFACSPTIGIQAPEKPITINLNVKIDHEIKVKVDKDLENVISEKSDLF